MTESELELFDERLAICMICGECSYPLAQFEANKQIAESSRVIPNSRKNDNSR